MISNCRVTYRATSPAPLRSSLLRPRTASIRICFRRQPVVRSDRSIASVGQNNISPTKYRLITFARNSSPHLALYHKIPLRRPLSGRVTPHHPVLCPGLPPENWYVILFIVHPGTCWYKLLAIDTYTSTPAHKRVAVHRIHGRSLHLSRSKEFDFEQLHDCILKPRTYLDFADTMFWIRDSTLPFGTGKANPQRPQLI